MSWPQTVQQARRQEKDWLRLKDMDSRYIMANSVQGFNWYDTSSPNAGPCQPGCLCSLVVPGCLTEDLLGGVHNLFLVAATAEESGTDQVT